MRAGCCWCLMCWMTVSLSLSGCGGTLTTPSGIFMSPNYPMPYYRNSECYWLLKSSRGSPFEIQFEQFHLEPHPKCTFDYLAVCTVFLISYIPEQYECPGRKIERHLWQWTVLEQCTCAHKIKGFRPRSKGHWDKLESLPLHHWVLDQRLNKLFLLIGRTEGTAVTITALLIPNFILKMLHNRPEYLYKSCTEEEFSPPGEQTIQKSLE